MYEQPTRVTFKSLAFLGFPAYRVGDDGGVWTCLKWTRKGQPKTARSIYFMGNEWKKMKVFYAGPMGYPAVTLKNPDTLVSEKWYNHVLVLTAFVGPCPDNCEARHVPDNDPTNCNLSNLKWGTHVENMADKISCGTNVGNRGACRGMRYNNGEKNGNSLLTEADVRWILESWRDGSHTVKEMAGTLNVGYNEIWYIVKRKRWAHIAI